MSSSPVGEGGSVDPAAGRFENRIVPFDAVVVLVPRHRSALPPRTTAARTAAEATAWFASSLLSDRAVLSAIESAVGSGVTDAPVDSRPDTDADDGAARRRRRRVGQTLGVTSVLVLQCHSEGSAWRGLVPALTSSAASTKAASDRRGHESERDEDRELHRSRPCGHASSSVSARRAASVLVRQFESFVRTVESPLSRGVREEVEEETEMGGQEEGSSSSPVSPRHPPWSVTCIPHRSPRVGRRRILILVILPPDPTVSPFRYSGRPPSDPLNLLTPRLVLGANNLIRLNSLDAYVATLGGGYFLCRYLSTAVTLARRQRFIARLKGDPSLVDRCTLNEAYNYIHAGNVGRARRLIAGARIGAEGRGDGLVERMCDSADWFADRVEELGSKEAAEAEERRRAGAGVKVNPNGGKDEMGMEKKKMKGGKEMGGKKLSGVSTAVVLSATNDDFQRIRIVRDRITPAMTARR